ncbi:MAG: ATP synthase F1 subunit epsilon [Bacteroidales bacterium]|nr:ATP synthase F1 subunit epsilon [Bacteroidales bacterium]
MMLYIKIIHPEGKLFEGEISMAQFPGSMGSFQVLPNHAPLVSSLEAGNIRVRTSQNEEKLFSIKGGFVEVFKNTIIALVTV